MAQDRWLVDGPKIIELDGVRKLKVGLVAGQVDIVGHDEESTRIEVHSVRGKELKITITDDVLEIDHPQLSWENWLDAFKTFRGSARADISIMVPRNLELKFGVVSATALISGLNSEASISTVNGDVVVDGINGDIQVNGVSGEISIQSHYGNINAHSINGDITAAGEIFEFTADTVSGDVYLDVSGLPQRVKINTVNGNTTTRLANGVPAQYRINTVNGRLQLDDSEITGVRGSYSGKYGSLDKHWLEFAANTVSGNISVLHAVSA
jgi:hypothetical protein